MGCRHVKFTVLRSVLEEAFVVNTIAESVHHVRLGTYTVLHMVLCIFIVVIALILSHFTTFGFTQHL
jgi:hypothetical protein